MNVFISYSHIDNVFVQNLSELLDEKKIPYFLDRKSIEWGDDIPEGIKDGIETASHLLVVVSPASLKSSWVPYEIGMARARGVKILPLLTHPSLDLPGFIANLSYKVSLESLVEFFDEGIRRASTLELALEVGHMVIFNEGQSYAMTKAKDNLTLSDLLPIYFLTVKNIGMRSIVIDFPLFEFKKSQPVISTELDLEIIGFDIDNGEMMKSQLKPQGQKRFHSTMMLACAATQGFLNNNVKRIYLTDDQGFESEVSNKQMEIVESYCQKFFSNIDLLEVLTAQREHPSYATSTTVR
jgi:TIR domain